VVACLKKGMAQNATAELCGMAQGTLTKEQERDAQRVIADKTPDQLKLPYALWTRQAVREMIERRYERKLAVRSVGNYLKRWGFTPQKPLLRAYEQNPHAVRRWLEEEFPAIKDRAKAEGRQSSGATRPACAAMMCADAVSPPKGSPRPSGSTSGGTAAR
jgi:transposase